MLSKSVMERMILVCSIGFLLLRSSAVSGANLSLEWNPSPSANVAGYTLLYGATNGVYTSKLVAGTNTTVTVTGLTPGQTYHFVVFAYGTDCYVSPYSNDVTNTVPTLPLVLAQPKSQTVAIGTIVVLSVDVVSDPPVSFQWFVGGVAIKGATNSMLILPQISKENAGSYKVVVSNAGGSVTSQVAIITILNLPGSLPVRARAGVYYGLFYQTNAGGAAVATEATTGFLANCTIGTNGAYSSRLIIEGLPFSFSGVLNEAGEIAAIVDRTNAGLSNLSLTLYATAALGTCRMAGVVSNMNSTDPWVALLDASCTTNAFSPAAGFLFLSPPPPGRLLGTWTCQFTLPPNGVALLAGQLGDGASIWQTESIGADGSFPVYQSLYNNTGLLAGWLTVAGGAPVGNLTWIQPADPSELRTGFTNIISFGAGPGSSTNRFQLTP
jgi:hypothetical protein